VRAALVHLGCARNLVDSEVILGRLAEGGLLVCGDPDDADVAILNTCAFIGPAREESRGAIRDLVRRKQRGRLRAVVVVGCLPERLGRSLVEEFPEVDAFAPLSDYSEIAALVRRVAGGRPGPRFLEAGVAKGAESDRVRLLSTPRSHAYLRLAEGCDHSCAFCAIPGMRGKMRSKPLETIVAEAVDLAALGVRELVLVAEDTTGYGRDLYGRSRLADAIERVAGVEGIGWVRAMYAYPNAFPWDVARVLRDHPRVVEYLDIPIQHVADEMLRAMRRGSSGPAVRALLGRLREEVPGIALRTTLLVGFPGETDAHFEELLAFVREFRFERLGVFAYSREEGTPAFETTSDVPTSVAKARRAAILEAQREIVRERNASLVGSEVEVLVDGRTPRGGLLARTRADAPEVDCTALLPADAGEPGEFARVRVAAVDPSGYDLRAEAVRMAAR
jgi:ribosomal protein S12 methylthiotransferase